jgi:hypothetical protein
MSFEEALKTGNPIFEENNGWYFSDEMWSSSLGPFDSKELAEKACSRYVTMVLNGGSDPHPELAETMTKLKWR